MNHIIPTIDKNVINLHSMKFITAKDGPMLRILLKVSKLRCPSLKAMIVKALSKGTHYVKKQNVIYDINIRMEKSA